MDPAVVIPLLTEKIAASKRKKGAAKLVGGMTLTWYASAPYPALPGGSCGAPCRCSCPPPSSHRRYRRKQFKEKKRAAMITTYAAPRRSLDPPSPDRQIHLPARRSPGDEENLQGIQ